MALTPAAASRFGEGHMLSELVGIGGLFVPKPTPEVAHHPLRCLTCLALFVNVRWHPLMFVAVVTHLVTHLAKGVR